MQVAAAMTTYRTSRTREMEIGGKGLFLVMCLLGLVRRSLPSMPLPLVGRSVGDQGSYLCTSLWLPGLCRRADSGMGASAVDDSTRGAVTAARKLLDLVKLKPGESPTRYKVLQAYAMMALHEKPDIEQALRHLLEMAARDRDHVPVLLALATAFLLLGQTAKARNQLKRISKLPYRPANADEFERRDVRASAAVGRDRGPCARAGRPFSLLCPCRARDPPRRRLLPEQVLAAPGRHLHEVRQVRLGPGALQQVPEAQQGLRQGVGVLGADARARERLQGRGRAL